MLPVPVNVLAEGVTMFRSRVWGIGWNPSGVSRRLVQRPRSFAEKICGAGLTSVPGRTARLKAIYLLQIAAEIEHALMVQYLYAAYSIDDQFAEGRNDRLLSIVNRWKRDLRIVARQEMAHLITVQNLLMAVGADIYVNRENNFLLHPDAYPFPVRFEPLSLNRSRNTSSPKAPNRVRFIPVPTRRDSKMH
jgi:hypothetical protein